MSGPLRENPVYGVEIVLGGISECARDERNKSDGSVCALRSVWPEVFGVQSRAAKARDTMFALMDASDLSASSRRRQAALMENTIGNTTAMPISVVGKSAVIS